ncbi:hypothetical protein ACWGR1_23720, partial [Nocardiopsis flavescens]
MRRRTDAASGPSRRGLLAAAGAAGLTGLAAGAAAGHTAAGARAEPDSALAPARGRAGAREGLPPALLAPTPAQVHHKAVDQRGGGGGQCIIKKTEPTRTLLIWVCVRVGYKG